MLPTNVMSFMKKVSDTSIFNEYINHIAPALLSLAEARNLCLISFSFASCDSLIIIPPMIMSSK